jgi:DNA-binding GntR family transcriptional regulator
MAARISHLLATLPADLAELRVLVELSAVRKLASRGLSDQEHALVRKLADATLRAARNGDVPGYVRADVVFHLGLLELTADPALSEVAPVLLAAGRVGASTADLPGYLLRREAREHRELVGMIADGMVSAVDHLLRLHLSRQADSQEAPPAPAGAEPAVAAGA